MTSLYCGKNKLTTLDVSKNTAFTSLNCWSNQLTTLDVSKNLALTGLHCDSNQLTTLDVSKNLGMTSLDCSSNRLTTLDVSKNTALTYLACSSNQLTTLDVSKNTALTYLACSSNYILQTLNLKNGKNSLLTTDNIFLSYNSNLYCILVDDVNYSNTNWAKKKDSQTTFNSVECKSLTLPSNNFTIQAKGETCTGSNNGELNITAIAVYTYKAIINGQSYSFTNNNLKVVNLAPRTYIVSIYIVGETFRQDYTVIIPKAATITGKSSIAAQTVNVEITEGTAPYTVFVNGIEQFETNDSSFSVTASRGGLLEVKTAKDCEGIYSKDIVGLETIVSAYPNPTYGSFEIELPTSKNEVTIEISTLDGRIISNRKYTLENGIAKLTLENQPQGVYVAKIYLDTIKSVKIIKN